MFRYKLRTLLIVLALGPPVLAGAWFFAFDMSAHDRSVTVQLLLLFVVAVTIMGAAWSAGTVYKR